MSDEPDARPQVSTSEVDRSPTDVDITAGGDEQTSSGDGSPGGFDFTEMDTRSRSELEIARSERERLEEENERLRMQWAANAGRTRHGRIAIGFALLGICVGALAYVFPESRAVLFAIAATGLASGLLIRYLNTEQLVSVRVSEEMIEPLLTNEAAMVDQLGLSSKRVYLPTEAGVRLVVPKVESYDPDALVAAINDEYDRFGTDRPFVFDEPPHQSGLSLRPSAGLLLKSFIVQRDGERPETASKAIASLQEGVTDALKLADSVETEFDQLGRVTFEIDGTTFSSTGRFDPPVVSFLGAGMAWALSTPIEVDAVSIEGGTLVVTYQWDAEATETRTETASG
jgi:hypothetical protein